MCLILESTFGRGNKATIFRWQAREKGVEIVHDISRYIVPWDVFHTVLDYARSMARKQGGVLKVGPSQDKPPAGSLGHWVKHKTYLALETGPLTPRHLSFLGPIYARMGFLSPDHEGKAILWRMPDC